MDDAVAGVIVDVKERSAIVKFGKQRLARVTREGFHRNGVAVPQHVPLTSNLKVDQTVTLVNLRPNRCVSDEQWGICFYADVHVTDPPFVEKVTSDLPTQYYKPAGSAIDKNEDTRSWTDDGSVEPFHSNCSTNDLLPSGWQLSPGISIRGTIEPPALYDSQGIPSTWKVHTIPNNNNNNNNHHHNNTRPAETVSFDQGTQTISTGEIIACGIYPGM